MFRGRSPQIERDYRSGEWGHAPGRRNGHARAGRGHPLRLGEGEAVRLGGGVRGRRRRHRRLRGVEVRRALHRRSRRQSPRSRRYRRPMSIPRRPLQRSPLGRRAVERARAARARSSPAPRSTARPRANSLPVPPANAADTEPPLDTAEQRLTAGHIADACALGLVAAAHTPEDAAIWEFLGRCHMRVPDPRQARAYYRRYLALAPARRESLVHPRNRRAGGAMMRATPCRVRRRAGSARVRDRGDVLLQHGTTSSMAGSTSATHRVAGPLRHHRGGKTDDVLRRRPARRI